AVAKHERRRHHADDLVAVVVHQHGAADHGPIAAITALPQAVADDDDGRARAVFLIREDAADPRLDAEDAEEVRGHRAADDLLGFAVAGEARRGAARGGEIDE